MRKKSIVWSLVFCLLATAFTGCSSVPKTVKIGVSLGVGAATRWDQEKVYMEERAKDLGADIEVRLNRTEEVKSQYEDCVELIDSGIHVLILTPRDASKAGDILAYAKEKNVPVINYARVVLGEKVDLFVGYDSERIGQKLGQYLVETVFQGDYIILRGDSGDNNAQLLYDGAMRYIDTVKEDINILLDTAVEGWSPDKAKELVMQTVSANGNQVDAILAPNDALAGACALALEELGVQKHVTITGMDAQLDAVKRIVAGTQDMTIYMDLKELAYIAVDEAVHMAKKEDVNVNANFDNGCEGGVQANLITGQLIMKENLDSILIDGGYFTRDEVYGESSMK